MKKYIEVSKIFGKAQLSWRFNIASSMMFTTIKILFAIIVWGAIFEGQDVVSGFTYQTMLTYYVISAFLSQLESENSTSWEIAATVRQGTFSKYMILPARVDGYFLSRSIGKTIVQALFVAIATAACVLIFGVPLQFTTDPLMIGAALLMEAIALLFSAQLNYLIGLSAFRFKEVDTFLMIKDNLANFATGMIVPLALLPMGIQSVMRFFPFYYITYLPSMLLIGRGVEEVPMGLLVISLWALAAIIASPLLYNKLRRQYDGVGI